jgi:glutathione synthase
MLDHPWDTTVRLLTESMTRGNENYWCDCSGISWRDSDTVVSCRRVLDAHPLRQREGFSFGAFEQYSPTHFDKIMIRADSPLTRNYIYVLELIIVSLEAHGRDTEQVLVNPPSIILAHNDKILACLTPEITPRTIISRNYAELSAFAEEERAVVLKPLYEHQSKGVELLKASDGAKQIESVLRRLTTDFQELIVAQRYLSHHRETEKRVWFLDGQVIGHGLKCSLSERFPLEMNDGCYILATALTRREEDVCQKLSRELQQRHIRLAGVDLIDGYVTDINVISPGLIVELENALGQNIAARIIYALEAS